MFSIYRSKDEGNWDKKKFFSSLFFPFIFIIILWMIEIVESSLNLNFVKLGILPLHAEGLLGIITSPLIHSDFKHLFNNSIPILILGTSIFYFYREVAYNVFFLTWIISGIWVWVFARTAYHIGASNLVYGFASFLFFSGVIRKNINLLAISLLVIFLYGSLIWGIFPIDEGISWEGHLMGGLAGLVLAIYYKDHGPEREKYDWEDEEDEDEENPDHDNMENQNKSKINYIYKEK